MSVLWNVGFHTILATWSSTSPQSHGSYQWDDGLVLASNLRPMCTKHAIFWEKQKWWIFAIKDRKTSALPPRQVKFIFLIFLRRKRRVNTHCVGDAIPHSLSWCFPTDPGHNSTINFVFSSSCFSWTGLHCIPKDFVSIFVCFTLPVYAFKKREREFILRIWNLGKLQEEKNVCCDPMGATKCPLRFYLSTHHFFRKLLQSCLRLFSSDFKRERLKHLKSVISLKPRSSLNIIL